MTTKEERRKRAIHGNPRTGRSPTPSGNKNEKRTCDGNQRVVWMKNLKSNPLSGFSSLSSFMASCACTGLPPQYSPSDIGRGTDPLTYGQAWTMSMALIPPPPPPPPTPLDGPPSFPTIFPPGDDPAHHSGWIMNADRG